MSSEALLPGKAGFLAAWQRKDTIWLSGQSDADLSAGETDRGQKHPALARNKRGDVLLAWTEGMGWNQGGDVAWRIIAASGASNPQQGRAKGIPAHGSLAAFARPDGGFVVLY